MGRMRIGLSEERLESQAVCATQRWRRRRGCCGACSYWSPLVALRPPRPLRLCTLLPISPARSAGADRVATAARWTRKTAPLAQTTPACWPDEARRAFCSYRLIDVCGACRKEIPSRPFPPPSRVRCGLWPTAAAIAPTHRPAEGPTPAARPPWRTASTSSSYSSSTARCPSNMPTSWRQGAQRSGMPRTAGRGDLAWQRGAAAAVAAAVAAAGAAAAGRAPEAPLARLSMALTSWHPPPSPRRQPAAALLPQPARPEQR